MPIDKRKFMIRPAEPERDFGQLAAWISDLEDEPTSESDLMSYHQDVRQRITSRVGADEEGRLSGFYWFIRDRSVPNRVEFFLYVQPEQRRQGIGTQLYDDMLRAIAETQAKILRVRVWDDCPECLDFAERRGFSPRSHRTAWVLDLQAFNDQPYDEIITKLKGEGFQFTSMEALGNTEEAQRYLYTLNDMTAMETPGSEGEHAWESFEDFRKSVCQAEWYKPGGQMVVIDTSTGTWAGMSAITRFKGTEYAYNLHTGVDKRYRGRKLAQAVKVLSLRYAREVLMVNSVHTHHNARNLPMIAIDRKLGYQQIPGSRLMEKIIE